MVKIRANRDKPGLRPQHQKAVEAVAALAEATVTGGGVGSRDLTFTPAAYVPRDLSIDIGTAGSTGLVLQTLHLPWHSGRKRPIGSILTGGTFNPKAPALPFLDATWRAYLEAFGMPLTLKMTAAGFLSTRWRPHGSLDRAGDSADLRQTDPDPLHRISGVAGVANLRDDIARRMRDRAIETSAGTAGSPPRSIWCAGPAQGRGPHST